MQEITYRITNPRGIHARPAGELVNFCQSFKSEALIGSAERMVNGKHLLEVMKLSLQQGDLLELKFSGEDEAAAADAALKFLEQHL